jgi:NAD-dependent deacetylase
MPPADLDAAIDRARAMLTTARRVAVLTGAGISAESGVPTYRGAGGLWAAFNSADVASAEGFARDPARVWTWHNERRMGLADVRPNAAHHALARIEEAMRARGGRFTLITQNIDGLHQAAGSSNVLELHGSILHVRCTACGAGRHVGFECVDALPRCDACGAAMRPDIVWFGEMLPQDVWREALDAATWADVLVTVGTSAVVYPAAGLVEMAAGNGARTIEVNLEPTGLSEAVDISLIGKAGDLLPRLAG